AITVQVSWPPLVRKLSVPARLEGQELDLRAGLELRGPFALEDILMAAPAGNPDADEQAAFFHSVDAAQDHLPLSLLPNKVDLLRVFFRIGLERVVHLVLPWSYQHLPVLECVTGTLCWIFERLAILFGGYDSPGPARCFPTPGGQWIGCGPDGQGH